MTTKATHLLTYVFLASGLFVFGQENRRSEALRTESKKYFLTISMYNHAHRIFDGTMIYILEQNNLKVRRRKMFSETDTTLFSKTIDNHSLDRIQTIPFDNLKDYYYNNCILITSGNEYFVSISKDDVTRTIRLHHYYHIQIALLFNELNKQIPDPFKIDYLTSETKQDCE